MKTIPQVLIIFLLITSTLRSNNHLIRFSRYIGLDYATYPKNQKGFLKSCTINLPKHFNYNG
ncbi:MAG: hypothetical protein COA79_11975 [Planctomycetota bacterium]|nr:MAG: hypothetical protein COA79_11975 [Planctomycetota bacterium]